jgi:hypothetical protein
VHCIAILSLLSPGISPWRVRERIWRHFGDLRLLHLLDDKDLIRSVLGLLDASDAFYGNSYFNTKIKNPISTVNDRGGLSKSALLVSKAIVITLSNLRQESDNTFYICTIGIVHIAASIFCYSRFENGLHIFDVKGPETRHFRDLLSDGNVPNWIIMNIILSVEKYFMSELTDESHRNGLLSKDRKTKILDEFHASRIESNESNLTIDVAKFSSICTIEVHESDGKIIDLFDFIETFRSQFFE